MVIYYNFIKMFFFLFYALHFIQKIDLHCYIYSCISLPFDSRTFYNRSNTFGFRLITPNNYVGLNALNDSHSISKSFKYCTLFPSFPSSIPFSVSCTSDRTSLPESIGPGPRLDCLEHTSSWVWNNYAFFISNSNDPLRPFYELTTFYDFSNYRRNTAQHSLNSVFFSKKLFCFYWIRCRKSLLFYLNQSISCIS